MKQLKKMTCAFIGLMAITGVASADPILTDLPSDTYITLNGLEWTWASSVNEQYWYGYNELFDPSLHSGWRFATDDELAMLPSIEDFNWGNINSAAYWNSDFHYVDASDLENGYVSSQWGQSWYETFYVRDVITQTLPPEPVQSPVPEPETYLMLLAGLGLLSFTARRRKQSA